MNSYSYPQQVERWDVFEVSCPGYSDKNPFVDYYVKGQFKSKSECIEVNGFYDGSGIFRVRFMPSFVEKYSFKIYGSFSNKEFSGEFDAIPATGINHGPIRVANQYHFAYEDGTPYYSVGTTCYVWTHQPEYLQEETLKELSNGYFNKIRFCVFPKHYDYNLRDPITFPYEGTPMDCSVLTKDNFMEYVGNPVGNHWDFTRFNAEHFQLFEKRIVDLMKLGIEADLIIMHPYDRWGFSLMSKEHDDLYWKYVIARFGAYRNVWWSLANEHDLMPQKTIEDWERYASILCVNDPYNHLRSIHNCRVFYDHTRPWITHSSIQRTDLHKTAELTTDWRERYGKPVVLDEITYEGNINHCWGNISGKELVRRFWESTVRGGYCGHGETYVHPDDILWWSHGGKLHGESQERIKFLHKILCETPGLGLTQLQMRIVFGRQGAFTWDDIVAIPCDLRYQNNYYLIYFGIFRPSFRTYHLDDVHTYEVEVIDTWDMTVTNAGCFKGRFKIDLPGKEYIAIRIKKLINKGDKYDYIN